MPITKKLNIKKQPCGGLMNSAIKDDRSYLNPFDNYREILKREFLHRRSKQTNYSLRKYADDLGLKPNHLSYILRDKRGLSKSKSIRVCGGLKLPHNRARKFLFLVSAESGRSLAEKNLAKQWLKHNKSKGL